MKILEERSDKVRLSLEEDYFVRFCEGWIGEGDTGNWDSNKESVAHQLQVKGDKGLNSGGCYVHGEKEISVTAVVKVE